MGAELALHQVYDLIRLGNPEFSLRLTTHFMIFAVANSFSPPQQIVATGYSATRCLLQPLHRLLANRPSELTTETRDQLRAPPCKNWSSRYLHLYSDPNLHSRKVLLYLYLTSLQRKYATFTKLRLKASGYIFSQTHLQKRIQMNQTTTYSTSPEVVSETQPPRSTGCCVLRCA